MRTRAIGLGIVSALTALVMLIPAVTVSADEISGTTSASAIDTPPNPRHMWSGHEQSDSSKSRSLRASNPYWGTDNGRKVFYDGYGEVYLSSASKVIDVSEWNGTIDWQKVKDDGVDAAVLRIGYGTGVEDKTFAQNLKAVRALGIPFGVYLYSYAYDANFAEQEGESVATLLKKYGLTSKDLTLPVYYDLEDWADWGGHTHPTKPAEYEKIVNAFFTAMSDQGYKNVSIYSGTYYLDTALASQAIWTKTSWVAEWGPKLNFSAPNVSTRFNWQYSESGTVNGISGNVDMSAFHSVEPGKPTLGGFIDVYADTPHAQDVVWLASQKITTGWTEPDGSITFRGNKAVVRQDMAAFLYRLAGSPEFDEATAKNPFNDVNKGTPHYKEILWLASTGIATGWTADDGAVTFRGDVAVNRQDMAAFLNRYASYKGDKNAASWKPYDNGGFSDVNKSTPHQREILWLSSRGITQGWTDGNKTTFRGGSSVVRQDMAAFLKRITDYLGIQ